MIERLEELFSHHWEVSPIQLGGWPSGAGRVLLPMVFLAPSIRQQRHSLLLLGLATGLVSLGAFYLHVDPGPFWAFLVVCGLLAIASGLAVRRFFDIAPDKIRRDLFMAKPLFTDPEVGGRLATAASVVTLTPEVRPLQEGRGFERRRGESGSGASGSR